MKLMMALFFFGLIGSVASADSNTIKFGRDLCKVVSFRNSTHEACDNWVIENNEKTFYPIALNVCVNFNEGPSSRIANCFERAALWTKNQDLRDQVELCVARNGNYNPRAECLRDLFVRKNAQEASTAGGQSGKSSTAR